jgi:hypothetical protein
MRRIGSALLIGGLVAIPLYCLTGCFGSPKPLNPSENSKSKSTPIEAGRIQFEGWSLVPPKSWTVIDFRKEDWKRSVENAISAHPKSKNLRRQAEGSKQTGLVKLLAADTRGASDRGFSSMNAIVEQANPDVTLNSFAEASQVGLQSAVQNKQALKGEKLKLPSGPGVRYRWSIAGASFTTYLLLHEGKAFTFTFAAVPGQEKAVFETSRQVMHSVRFDDETRDRS